MLANQLTRPGERMHNDLSSREREKLLIVSWVPGCDLSRKRLGTECIMLTRPLLTNASQARAMIYLIYVHHEHEWLRWEAWADV